MKNLFVLFGMAAGLMAPFSVQASPEISRAGVPVDQRITSAHKQAATSRAPKTTQALYYITRYTPTGSHIPMVFCKYQGRYYSMNSFASDSVYGQGDIGLSGSLNVGGALRTLDPAISSVGGR